jgi:imidazolonepropionase-like amidohydrolase
VYQVLDRPNEVALTGERLKYLHSSTVEGWRWALENVIKAGRTPEETAQRQELLDRRLAFVGELASVGVPVVAGIDGGDVPFVVPGFSLHDELALLVRAGLSPMSAIRAATVESARLPGMDSLGTVEVGELADLVVLDADPLTDIRDTTRIHTVLSRGRSIDADQRTTMLADVARQR